MNSSSYLGLLFALCFTPMVLSARIQARGRTGTNVQGLEKGETNTTERFADPEGPASENDEDGVRWDWVDQPSEDDKARDKEAHEEDGEPDEAQFGPGTKSLSVQWKGVIKQTSVTFNMGSRTVNGNTYASTKIRQLKDNECLSECKVTGKQCNNMFSRLKKSRARKYYVAGARDFGGLNNFFIYWDYKLCCAVSECSASTWQVNYEVFKPMQQIHKYSNYEIEPRAQCLCCKPDIQCDETVSYAPKERCADHRGLPKVDELVDKCEAALKVKSEIINVKHELGEAFKGRVTVPPEQWWDRCKKVCASADLVPKTVRL